MGDVGMMRMKEREMSSEVGHVGQFLPGKHECWAPRRAAQFLSSSSQMRTRAKIRSVHSWVCEGRLGLVEIHLATRERV